MDGLMALAAIMDVAIEWEDFMPAGWVGAYCAVQRVVYLLRGMPRAKTRTTLAHELGHAHYGHPGVRTTAYEWTADVWAAGVLISPAVYLEAVRDRPAVEELARRLDVTPHLVRVAIRAGLGPSNFIAARTVKLRVGTSTAWLPAAPVEPRRSVEPRRLTRAIPTVPPPAPLPPLDPRGFMMPGARHVRVRKCEPYCGIAAVRGGARGH